MTERDFIVLLVVAVLSFCIALFQCGFFLSKRKKMGKTTGTILSIQSSSPYPARWRNSRWATVTYKIGDRQYTSENKVPVSFTKRTGSQIPVLYDLEHPQTLYSFSFGRTLVFFGLTVFCTAVIFWYRKSS